MHQAEPAQPYPEQADDPPQYSPEAYAQYASQYPDQAQYSDQAQYPDQDHGYGAYPQGYDPYGDPYYDPEGQLLDEADYYEQQEQKRRRRRGLRVPDVFRDRHTGFTAPCDQG